MYVYTNKSFLFKIQSHSYNLTVYHPLFCRETCERVTHAGSKFVPFYLTFNLTDLSSDHAYTQLAFGFFVHEL